MPTTTTPPSPDPAAEALRFPRAALDTVLDAARIAAPVVQTDEGRAFAFVPRTMDLKDITDPERLPRMPKAAIEVDNAASLSAYINRFAGDEAILIADYDAGEITGIIDWHPHNAHHDFKVEAGAVQHRATLKLRPSEEYARWDAFEGEMHSQAEFAAFLEENSVDVILPEAATLLEIARDLEATQGVTFKSAVRLESGDRAFTYENETRVKGDLKVPREFRLSIPLYADERPMELRAALRFRVNGGGLALGFEWRRVEYVRRGFFVEMATRIAEETGRPLYFGRRK